MSGQSLTPEVTVVIATRNRRAWLEEAIASVEAQTSPSWELIVVDDASTDDTWAWLESRADESCRVFRNERQRERSATRNRGLAAARGGLVMFLDDDDGLRPRALELLSAALQRDADAVAAVGARWDWFCDGRGGGRRDSHPWWTRQRKVFGDLIFGWSFGSGQVLLRTAAVRTAGEYDAALSTCEDRDLWLRVARLGPFEILPAIVMNCRVHPGQRRPDDLMQIRERVARRAIRRQPRAERRRWLGVRRSAALVQTAEQALSEGKFLVGTQLAARAWAAAPGVWFSPLIGPWVLRRLARRVWHRWRDR